MGVYGDRLKQARELAGLTLGQVQEYTGIYKSQLSKIERNQGMPTAETLAVLARLYHVSADSLLELRPELVLLPGAAVHETRAEWPPWAGELIQLVKGMSGRGQTQVLALARALAAEERQWRQYDALIEALRERAPGLLDELETRLASMAQEGHAGGDALLALLAELLGTVTEDAGENG